MCFENLNMTCLSSSNPHLSLALSLHVSNSVAQRELGWTQFLEPILWF